MIILRCSEQLDRVGVGFTCLVDVRTLRHLTTAGMVSSMQALGVPLRNVDKKAFLDVLAALSIPNYAVTGGANWSGR